MVPTTAVGILLAPDNAINAMDSCNESPGLVFVAPLSKVFTGQLFLPVLRSSDYRRSRNTLDTWTGRTAPECAGRLDVTPRAEPMGAVSKL